MCLSVGVQGWVPSAMLATVSAHCRRGEGSIVVFGTVYRMLLDDFADSTAVEFNRRCGHYQEPLLKLTRVLIEGLAGRPGMAAFVAAELLLTEHSNSACDATHEGQTEMHTPAPLVTCTSVTCTDGRV